ncbi:MAG TPA: ATP-dependent DNA helicase RecG, partial [Spirochaetales bacterium]|nr:ATP-dependent DNA helicase RecG [Spirochaetales bacterium]
MFVRELNDALSSVKGAGPAVLARLARLGLYCASDLLLFAPRAYEDRSQKRLLGSFAQGPVNCTATVVAHDWFGFGRMRTLKLWIEDEEGTRAALVCFNRAFLEKQFPPESRVIVFGSFEYKYNDLQSANFDIDALTDGQDYRGSGILPVYPLTEGLAQGTMRKLAARAVSLWSAVDDEIPTSIRAARGLLSMSAALRFLHQPAQEQDAQHARKTLAYGELFYLQIMIARRALERRREPVARTQNLAAQPGRLANALIERLNFSLSADQLAVLAEIRADMSGDYPMARLLQGDVGSGKTLVAFLAALDVIEQGGQAAIMAPTELLARQHAETAASLLEPLGVRLAFLSGNVADAARKPLLSALGSGDIDLVIGTHALFSADVCYKNLRFVVVDEQHRFGVLQRLAMGSKGERPDVLMMSATPIPRSLALTVYGDLSVSTIKTMPKGRKAIITHLAKQGNESRVYEFVRKRMANKERVYFVYPLVERSDRLELKDAEAMFHKLATEVFPEYKGGLIHARLSEQEKRDTMAAFKKGDLSFVVATSVVEVGVDVPEATCMVIEHAERFGLAALHQLRGRVGRGQLQSYCFLVWSENLGDEGKKRVMA